MTDLRTLRICARAAVTAVTGIVTDYLAVFRPPLTPVAVLGTWPCGGTDTCLGTPEYAQPLGEYPEVPLIVRPGGEDSCRKSSSSAAEVSAPVPGGVPRAAGDHSTSALLDEAAWSIAKLASGRPGNHDALDDLITELHERAEKFRAIEAMPMPLAHLIADASDGVLHRYLGDEPANPAFLQRLSRDLFAAARLVRASIPPDLSGGASKREVDSPAKRGP